MPMSVARLVRRMRSVLRDVDEENQARAERQKPELPPPAFGSAAACSDYLALIAQERSLRVDVDLSVRSLACVLKKADPADVREAWDLMLVEPIMEG